MVRRLASFALVFCGALALLAGCERSALPGAPLLWQLVPGQASVRLSWWAPLNKGRQPIAAYTASCSAAGERLTAQAGSSPVTVSGLSPGTLYTCQVTASNASGTGMPSAPRSVMLEASATQSLSAIYRAAPWPQGMSVTFPSECTMTLVPAPRPSHEVDALYLAPFFSNERSTRPAAQPQRVAQTAISQMPLALRTYEGPGVHEPFSVNICPRKAPNTTATNNGVIGWMVSGATLYKAAEITGHRATALNDNVHYQPKGTRQPPVRASFLDRCGGHPTPANAGNSYHYHGHSACVTALVDRPDGPSHLIGVALDGFPIYGDRDLQGLKIDPAKLDGCNGITSPTPEFPKGIYHYVLPSGVQQHHAAMRCYAGHVPARQWAAAEAAGFCYAPDQAKSAGPMGMPMGGLSGQGQKR